MCKELVEGKQCGLGCLLLAGGGYMSVCEEMVWCEQCGMRWLLSGARDLSEQLATFLAEFSLDVFVESHHGRLHLAII